MQNVVKEEQMKMNEISSELSLSKHQLGKRNNHEMQKHEEVYLPESSAKRKRKDREKVQANKIEKDLIIPREEKKTRIEYKKRYREKLRTKKEEYLRLNPKPPPKTGAERNRAYRERQRLLKLEQGELFPKPPEKSYAERKLEQIMRAEQRLLIPKQPPKSGAQRTREYRERKKQSKMEVDALYMFESKLESC